MKAFRRFFWFVPTVLWMVLIFHLSGQEGTASAGLSYKVAEKTAVILHETVLPDRSTDELITLIHPGVRKGAHMTEYAVLYTLLFLSFFFSTLATRSAAISIVVSFLYACLDEFHQSFVAGRSGNAMDVCVDMTGVLIAVAIILFIYSTWQGWHLEREETRRERLASETEERVKQARIEGAHLERERLRREAMKYRSGSSKETEPDRDTDAERTYVRRKNHDKRFKKRRENSL